jgi:large subunit ribosomal protein L4
MKITVYSKTGEKKEAVDQKVTLFDQVVNPALIHEVVVSQLANRREAAAKAKTRAEVSGGGKKPYKQKGTGRARTGSIRNPLWRGGGTVFGPTGIQNFARTIIKKKNRGAILSALATKKDAFIVLEDLITTKTKDFAKLYTKVVEDKKALIIFPALTENHILVTRNVPGVKVCDYRNLNVYDVLEAEKLVFVGNALELANKYWEAK